MAMLLKVDGTTAVMRGTELADLQAAVGGYIEHVTLADGRDAFINEEGKLNGLPTNMMATKLWLGPDWTRWPDVIVGAMVVCEPGEVE